MAKRKSPPPRGEPPTELAPRLRAAVKVVDEALDQLAEAGKPVLRRRTPPKPSRR